ncbi:MAG: elongation factor Ts [Candidatus Melainabacteria bacterium RIFOXYA12_FULL_32_12]|nr:MAG: elongation factor Ts [Candidatus Melainabacteria bacterium RIFOXYA2_FULL_32_9]OGI31884.1 MAG: elongation factor Ts [Candidatus Melainabacteria bacterium RIFOXYA12_FULL_32_12]
MSVSAEQVKELRDKTGAGFMDAKKALVENNGNMEKAAEYLRQKGIASAEKKMSRIAAEGLIGSYVHNGKIGVLVEVNCETDFVAKNDEFQQLVKDICLQIASSSPEYVSRDEIPQHTIEEEKRIESGKADLIGKPAEIIEKIVNGRVDKLMAERVLLEQTFVKDPSMTIEELIKSKIAKIGEKISIRRFTRYVLGEGLEKRKEDFAQEVMGQMKNA